MNVPRSPWIVSILLATMATSASAQGVSAPSQITPPPFDPITAPPSARGRVLPGDQGPVAPRGAENLSFQVRDVVVQGEFEDLASVRAELVGKIKNKTISVAEVFKLAQDLETAYVRAGYVLARVVVPAQELDKSAIVRLQVVDGRVSRIDSSGVAPRVADIVQRRLAPLVGVGRLRLPELERRLLLAGDVAGLELTSSLAPDTEAGTTVLIVSGKHRLTTTFLDADNRVSDSFGRWQFRTTSLINSPFGFGERLYGTLSSGREVAELTSDDPHLRVGALGLSVPIGSDGLTVSAEYSTSRTRPFAEPGVVEAWGRMRRTAARLEYPIIRTRPQTLSLSTTLESLRQSTTRLGTLFSRDDYVALRSAASLSTETWWSTPAAMVVTFSQGLGGRDEKDARQSAVFLSRQGTSPTFEKLHVDLKTSQPLPGTALQLDLYASAQTGFGSPLFVSEQLSLDGPTMVGGLPSGALSVDRGAAARLELLAPNALVLPGNFGTVTPYGFVAGGRGWLENPTAVESPVRTGRSYGIGLRSQFLGLDGCACSSLGFEFARQQSDTAEPDARVTFSVSTSF